MVSISNPLQNMAKSDGQNQCSIVDNFYFPSKISQFHAVDGGAPAAAAAARAVMIR
jgi:hypothetical protein